MNGALYGKSPVCKRAAYLFSYTGVGMLCQGRVSTAIYMLGDMLALEMGVISIKSHKI